MNFQIFLRIVWKLLRSLMILKWLQ